MTNRATLQALLNRVLEGEGPDRELDAEIACAVNGFTMHEDSNPGDGHFAFWHGKPWESLCSNCSGWPHYTTSLDVALTLLTDGWDWVRRVPGTMALVRGNDYRMAEVHPEPCRALIAAWIKVRMEADNV